MILFFIQRDECKQTNEAYIVISPYTKVLDYKPRVYTLEQWNLVFLRYMHIIMSIQVSFGSYLVGWNQAVSASVG